MASKVKPQMFRDLNPAEVKIKSQKLSSLKNLGPVMEKVMNQAGIKTVDQFFKIGWQKAILMLAKIHPRYRHTIYAQVLIGALGHSEWHRISAADKQAAKSFIDGLKSQSKARRRSK